MTSSVPAPPNQLSLPTEKPKKNFTQRVTDPESTRSPGSHFRRKRIARLLTLIEKMHSQHGSVSIIDIGGRRNYWNCVPLEFLRRNQTTITLVNLPGELDLSVPSEPPFFNVEGDGCNLSTYPDNSFHIVHSNSVIEHVGRWENMVRFAREVRRLAPNYYVQTPNFWFPIEPHFMKPFFHFLPRPIQAALVRRFSLGHFVKATSTGDALLKVEGINLLDRRMLRELFPDATLITEKCWLLTKSLTAYRESDKA